MGVTEFLNGGSLTGNQAAVIFVAWLGFVIGGGFLLVFSVP
ncbi:hypothetical protein [Natrarchaeobius chitinivorans]|nr:hypothetical protein [Natrarchaeobius chitinivorans]